MKRPIQKFIIGAATLFQIVTTSSAQQVYSYGIYPGSYWYVPSHVIGSPPFQFGYQEYFYYTDTTGSIIYFTAGRYPEPSDKQHWKTMIYFGPGSFSVPARPMTVGISASLILAVLVALGDWTFRFLRRNGTNRTDKS